jgi:hypothetical protein
MSASTDIEPRFALAIFISEKKQHSPNFWLVHRATPPFSIDSLKDTLAGVYAIPHLKLRKSSVACARRSVFARTA